MTGDNGRKFKFLESYSPPRLLLRLPGLEVSVGLGGLAPAVLNHARRGVALLWLGRHQSEVAAGRRGEPDRAKAQLAQLGGQGRHVVCVDVEVGLGRAEEREEERVGAQLHEGGGLEVHLRDPQLAARPQQPQRLGGHLTRRRGGKLMDHHGEAHHVDRAARQARGADVGEAQLHPRVRVAAPVVDPPPAAARIARRLLGAAERGQSPAHC
eukprot:scaffold7183_cov60-Phaeocystis_antarctica.AAC.4